MSPKKRKLVYNTSNGVGCRSFREERAIEEDSVHGDAVPKSIRVNFRKRLARVRPLKTKVGLGRNNHRERLTAPNQRGREYPKKSKKKPPRSLLEETAARRRV